MNPLVSIIIATYNASKTIRVALDSVLDQSFQDWECIIVDGSSKDNTIDIVKEFAKRDSRIKYISEPDKGIYDAFNKGWRMANGTWVQYLGSDDKLTKHGLRDMHLEDCLDYPIVSGDVYLIKRDGNVKLQKSIGYGGCHQGKFTQKDILNNLNGFDEQYRILADCDLMKRMEYGGLSIKNISIPVAYFATGGISQSLSGQIKRTKEGYRINCKFMSHANALYRALKYTMVSVIANLYRIIKSWLKSWLKS